MKKLLIIGIGAGNPEHLTLQAIAALNEVDVFFVMDKGALKSDLVEARREICRRFVNGRAYRTIEIADPPRDKSASSYEDGVRAWHDQRTDLLEDLIKNELGENGCGGFLAWGDPTLYDSILRIVDELKARARVSFDHEVIPGISSVQVLTARHRIAMNRIGETIRITTGRQLRDGLLGMIDNVFVMLDGECAFTDVLDQDLDIYWGAYLGTADEILIAGKLQEVSDEIQTRRAEARARHGWIMDIYLLRSRDKEAF